MGLIRAVARRISLAQLMTYGLVGVASLTCELSSFYLLREWETPLAFANVIARCIGGISAFTGNRLFTFSRPEQARGKLEHEALRYLTLFVVLTIASTVLLAFSTRVLQVAAASFWETATKLGIEVFVVACGFVAQKLWVFPEKKP